LDGSASAERALQWVKDLARITPMELILFRVVLPPRAAVLLAPMVEPATDSGCDRRLLSEEYLRSLTVDLRENGVETGYETRNADSLDEPIAELRAHFTREVGDIILARASEGDIDLVIMASHGMTGQANVKWGSVTQYLLSHIKKPILMVPVR
jgi:nucleotide-binding universal stress UspA family protein